MKQLPGQLVYSGTVAPLLDHCPICQCRTATVYRTLEPFWGEEYTLHVPNEFQAISIHVFDHDLMGWVGEVT